MAYRPTTDEEWAWLQRRFAALDYHPELRVPFDNSLKDSPFTPAERTSFRRQVFDEIRRLASPREAYPNPYFELSWFRAVRDEPALADPDSLAHNRATFYDAYFNRDVSATRRDAAQIEWDAISNIGPSSDLIETVTDGEELRASTE